MTREEAIQLRRIIEQGVASLDDETALQGVTLFPAWKSGQAYTAGDRVKYNDVLYKVLQDHTSQDDWTPAAAPSLFAEVLIPDSEVIPEWAQPDSTNPYMIGDRVKYNGKTYVSTIDNNVWAPDVYGWEEI